MLPPPMGFVNDFFCFCVGSEKRWIYGVYR